jgi:hypothetical protein
MPRFIFCQQDRSADSFKKVEHVMPQSFGRSSTIRPDEYRQRYPATSSTDMKLSQRGR